MTVQNAAYCVNTYKEHGAFLCTESFFKLPDFRPQSQAAPGNSKSSPKSHVCNDFEAKNIIQSIFA